MASWAFFLSNRFLCGLQVLISPAETKDGSGRPLEYEDLESGDVLFPRETVELERTITEPIEHPSIVVRQLTRFITVFLSL